MKVFIICMDSEKEHLIDEIDDIVVTVLLFVRLGKDFMTNAFISKVNVIIYIIEI